MSDSLPPEQHPAWNAWLKDNPHTAESLIRIAASMNRKEYVIWELWESFQSGWDAHERAVCHDHAEQIYKAEIDPNHVITPLS